MNIPLSLDWLKVKSAGNDGFLLRSMGVSFKYPLKKFAVMTLISQKGAHFSAGSSMPALRLDCCGQCLAVYPIWLCIPLRIRGFYSEQNVRFCSSSNYNHHYTRLHYTTLHSTTATTTTTTTTTTTLHHTTLH